MSRDLLEAADRIVTAYATVARWAAQDFKRRTGLTGLSPTQLAILARLDRSGSLTVSQLADYLDLAPPTVVRAVDALERKQLASRRRSHEDQREVMIAATPEGQQARAQLEGARRMRVAHLLGSLTNDEIEGLLLGYAGLARAAENEGGLQRKSG